jgi:hypothetical protein
VHICLLAPQGPNLGEVWLEGCPLAGSCIKALVQAVAGGRAPALKRLGLDTYQALAAPKELLKATGRRVRISTIQGSGPGYFKLERAAAATRGGDDARRAGVLVVSFGSAPGVPNWAGLLRRVRQAAEGEEEADFDVLYVVDPARSWYAGVRGWE